MKQKELSSAIYYILSQIMSAIASFVLLALFSRNLSSSEYGTYSMYVAIFTIVVVFIGWNTHMSIVRRKYEQEGELEEYVSSLITFQIFSISILSILSIIIFKWTMVSMSVVTAGLLSLSYIYFEYVRAIGEARKFFILNLCRQLGVMLLTIYLLYSGKGFESGVYSNIVVLILINIYYLIKLRITIKLNKEDIKYALMFSIPLIPFALGNVLLSYVDRFVVYEMLGSAETGQISFMSNFSNLFLLIIQAITLGWQPRVFEYIKNNQKNEIEKSAKMIFAFLTFVAVGMMMFSKEFTLLIGSKEYSLTYRFITPLIMANLFYFIYIFYTDFTIYYKKNSHLTAYVFLAVILKVMLSIVIATLLPFQYITFTSLIIFFILMALQYRHSKKIIEMIPSIKLFSKYVIIFGGSVLVYELMNNMTLSVVYHFIIRVVLMLMITAIIGFILMRDLNSNK